MCLKIKYIKIAVIMACYNRVSKTLESINALYSQVIGVNNIEVSIFLVDDGSTDGTSELIRSAYKNCKIYQGNGSLFWNGATRLAFGEAIKLDYDFYLWLNDDTIINNNSLCSLIETYVSLKKTDNDKIILVGSTYDVHSKFTTYGGVRRYSRWRPLKFTLINPEEKPIQCDTMNGNCVLIPREVVTAVGNLDSSFTHGMGDFDYGLRAAKAGCSIWIAPGYIGKCSRNSDKGTWKDKTLTVRERWKKVRQPKGLPPHEWKLFARRYAGPLWVFYWGSPYIKLFLSILKRSKNVLER
jgi:GT2 family glycosyltransferase